MALDWESIAVSLGALHPSGDPGGRTESGSADLGRRALCLVVGEKEIENAIEWYLASRPGSELVRSVLYLLESDYAIDRCYEIATADPDVFRRRAAVELLRIFATPRTLVWVKTFLESGDGGVQKWGMGLLDQLLFRRQIEPEQAEPFILLAEQHSSPDVRRSAEAIRKDIAGIQSGQSQTD